MSVIDGQNADAATFNAAFASKSDDNTMQGKQTLNRTGSGAQVVDVQQAINDVIASDALKIPLTQKAAANGVATLDASTLIPDAQIPQILSSKISDFNTAADARITAQKGAASGIAPLNASTKIDSTYLPSYVDDVVEVANFAALPVTGETGKIYVTLDTNYTYRWSGSVYVKIGQPIASTDDVAEGSTNLYFTSARVADKQIGIQFQDQGVNLGAAATVNTIDFIGAGITASRASNKVTVEVTATGGGGSKNYISQSSANPDFETGVVTPWQSASFTFSSGKPTGFSSPSPSMSIGPTTTNPLDGTTSMLLTKTGGVSSQYNGFISGEISISREDIAKVLYGSFSYEVTSSPSSVDFSGSSTQTLEIWIQNFNSGEWYQPAGWRGMNQSSGSGKVVFSFQTDGNPVNNIYKIAVLSQQSTTTAYTVVFDDFVLGPQPILLGNAMTDWQSYNPIVTASSVNPTIPTSGVTSHTAKWRRVGDSIELFYSYESTTVSGGSNGTGDYYFSIPSGLSIDTSKLSGSGSLNGKVAVGVGRMVTTTIRDATMFIESGNKLMMQFETGGTDLSNLASAVSVFTTNNSYITFTARFPIAGWSAFSQISSDTDNRSVNIIYSGNAGQTITANTTNIPFAVKDVDSHSSWSGSAFTAPVTGFYDINGAVYISVADGGQVRLYVDGAQKFNLSANMITNTIKNFSGSVWLNAGQQASLRTTTTATLVNTAAYHWLSISKQSGNAVVTATDEVVARMYSTAGTTGSGTTIVNFNNISFETHGGMCTTGASSKITAPVSGRYRVTAAIYFTNQANNDVRFMSLYKDGVEYSLLGQSPNVGLLQAQLTGSDIIELNAGQYIDIRFSNSGGFSKTLSTNGNYTYVSMERIK